MGRLKNNNHHIITVEKLIFGGQGISRMQDGQVVLIPDVLPGEEVAVEVYRQRKDYLFARALEILVPSEHRVEPHCQHYMNCGGCNFQHADYPYQTILKQEIITDILTRNCAREKIGAEYQLEDFVQCLKPFHYRQRIRLQVDQWGRVGFFKGRTRSVQPIDSCPLAVEEINQVLAILHGADSMMLLLGHTISVELFYCPVDSTVVILLSLSRKLRPAEKIALLSLFSRSEQLKSIWVATPGAAIAGPFVRPGTMNQGDLRHIGFRLPSEVVGRGVDLRCEPGGFCQVNLGQNEKLVKLMLAWAEVGESDRVLDLYCGMGNFSLPLALFAGEVYGTDLKRSSIRNAKINAADNGLDNCQFIRADAVEAARDLGGQDPFSLVLLDPPRAGCREIIPLLASLGAPRLLYISCDPATLVRDLRDMNRVGYEVVRIRGVDMFPQTHHIETITLLEKK